MGAVYLLCGRGCLLHRGAGDGHPPCPAFMLLCLGDIVSHPVGKCKGKTEKRAAPGMDEPQTEQCDKKHGQETFLSVFQRSLLSPSR